MKLYRYADQWVGLLARDNRLLCLNDTGRAIWLAHEEGRSVAEIAESLAGVSGLSFIDAENEISALVQAMSPGDRPEVAPALRPIWEISRNRDIEIPEPGGGVTCRVFQLGPTQAAVVADRFLIREILTPLLGHLQVANADAVHLLIRIGSESAGYRLVTGGEQMLVASLDELLQELLFRLLEAAYRVPPTLVVLHAGAVLTNDGNALLLIGSQGSGKSTLVAALAASGMPYLSDDLCPLDDGGRLIPVPAPQSLKAGSWPVLEQLRPQITDLPVYRRLGRAVRYLPPPSIEQDAWRRTWAVGTLVFPGYAPQAEPEIEPLNPIEKLQLMTLSNSLRGQSGLDEVLRWLEPIPAYRLRYSSLEQAMVLLSTVGFVRTQQSPEPGCL